MCSVIDIVASIVVMLGVLFGVYKYWRNSVDNYNNMILDIYIKVTDMLQKEINVHARAVILENQEYLSNTEFKDWKPFYESNTGNFEILDLSKIPSPKTLEKRKHLESFRKYAEQVCRSYDLAGKYLRIGISKNPYDLLARDWTNSIIKSWETVGKMIYFYRESRGDDFWSDFENLYKTAKKYKE